MKHIAIYVRVFSKRQDTASQKPDLERWAAAQRQEVTWYSDKFTGKTMDRPGWNRLMRQVEAGKVSAIVVWRLDRLGRTAKGLTALFQELFEQKVNLVSLRDGIDLNTPAGRLMAKMLASVARYETEVRAERVLAGQAKARADGKRGGWHLRSRAEGVADSPGICGSERRSCEPVCESRGETAGSGRRTDRWDVPFSRPATMLMLLLVLARCPVREESVRKDQASGQMLQILWLTAFLTGSAVAVPAVVAATLIWLLTQ